MINIENFRRDEIPFFNEKDYINERNNNKLSLRKIKNNSQIQKKRDYILIHNKQNNNIDKDLQFRVINFDSSYNIIENYLNSNNLDLISYSFQEIYIYFSMNCPSIKEQKKIIETKFLYSIYKFGNKFIDEKNLIDLSIILNILINIQPKEEGNNEFTKDIYSKDFLEFFNKCLNLTKELDNDRQKADIYRQIVSILNMMAYYHDDNIYDLNLIILRSQVFRNILDYYYTNNSCYVEDLQNLLKLINFTVDFSNQEDKLCNDDKNIINNCLKLLARELYSGGNKVDLLSLIFDALFHLSLLDDEYNCCEKLIEEGVPLKILKMKFNNFNLTKDYLNMIKNSMRILANILTTSDKNCQILYSNNIIDFYNNVLEKFDDNINIVKAILFGIYNISIGSKYEIIKLSNIWQEKNIQTYLNYNDEIKIQYIKIINNLLRKNDKEFIKFIYDSNILKYLIYTFIHLNIGKKCCFKILEIIDQYLCSFKKESKSTEEYVLIYNLFKDLFYSSEKVILLAAEAQNIQIIEKRIKENYE